MSGSADESSRWSSLQLDALREVGNVGCGCAAGALARLLSGRRIESELPASAELGPDAFGRLLGTGAEALWVAELDLREGLSGRLFCAVPPRAADELLERLLPEGGAAGTALSALSEAANILASAYLDGVAALTGRPVVPSPPRVERRRAADLDRAFMESPSSGSVAVATWFHATGDHPFRACLVFVPTSASLGDLFSWLRLSA